MFLRQLLVAVLLGAAYGLTEDEWDNVWEKAEKKCEYLMKFGPWSFYRFLTVYQADKKTLLTEIDDIPKRAKCFVSCFFDEVGLTQGTEINHKLYMKWLEEELKNANTKDLIIESVKNCIDGIEKKDKCNTAYDLYECFSKRYFS